MKYLESDGIGHKILSCKGRHFPAPLVYEALGLADQQLENPENFCLGNNWHWDKKQNLWNTGEVVGSE